MEASTTYLDMTFVERISAEARAALRHEIDTTTDKEQESLKRNNPEIYESWMTLVWELLDYENQHPDHATACSKPADEHNRPCDIIVTNYQPCDVYVTRKGNPRDTLYEIEYGGGPLSVLFDALHMSGTDRDAQISDYQKVASKSTRRARISTEQDHRPESDYRPATLYWRADRDGAPNERYQPGRWSGFEAPSPEPSPKHYPMHSSPNISPTTAEDINKSRQYWIVRGRFFDDNDNLIEEVKPFTANETFLAFMRAKDQDTIETTASRRVPPMQQSSTDSEGNPAFFAFIDNLQDPGITTDDGESENQRAPTPAQETAVPAIPARSPLRVKAMQPVVKPTPAPANPLDSLPDPYKPPRGLRRETRRLQPR